MRYEIILRLTGPGNYYPGYESKTTSEFNSDEDALSKAMEMLKRERKLVSSTTNVRLEKVTKIIYPKI